MQGLTAGPSLPEQLHVVVEIPAGEGMIKYEYDKTYHCLMVDRFSRVPMYYPCNYGFVPQTLADDGDPLDVLVHTPAPLTPGCVVVARPVGVLYMSDEAGEDAKILAVPLEKACPHFAHWQDIGDVPDMLKASIEHFFKHYKALEPNKWVEVRAFGDKKAAIAMIEEAVRQG